MTADILANAVSVLDAAAEEFLNPTLDYSGKLRLFSLCHGAAFDLKHALSKLEVKVEERVGTGV